MDYTPIVEKIIAYNEEHRQNIFIITHYLYRNWGEYRKYVVANSRQNALIKYFYHSKDNHRFYETVGFISNYFDIDDDEIGYNKINGKDDSDDIDKKLYKIIERLYKKYVYNEDKEVEKDTIYKIMDRHDRDKADFQKFNHNNRESLIHKVTHITCEKLGDRLIY